jgi:hypothetical protein
MIKSFYLCLFILLGVSSSLYSQQKIWSSDFTNASDWTITKNNTAGSLNWEITSAMPSSAANADLYKYWLTPASITTFKSTSGGNFLLMNASTAGAGIRSAIITKATPFNTIGKNNIKVQYNQLYRKWKDSTLLEVSTDGQKWTKFEYNDIKYKSDVSSSNPESVSIDISSVAGNKPQVWIRFRFLGTEGDYDYAWFIDDVEIFEIPQNELSVFRGLIKGQTQAIQSCLTNSNEILIYVKNNGLTTLNTGTVPINYKINGGNTVSENAQWLDYKTLQPKTSLAYNDTAICIFSNKLDFSSSNKFVVKSFVKLTNDVLVANDTATMIITNKLPTSVTNKSSFEENFEGASMNGFTALDIDKKGYSFGLASPGNTVITTGTQPNVLSCLRISEPTGKSDDWAFSPCLDLKKDFTYSLSLYARVSAPSTSNGTTYNYAGTYETKVGKSTTVDGMTIPVMAATTLTPDSKYYMNTSTFTVSEDGTYYLGIHGYNTDDTKNTSIRFDDISLTAKSKACDITSFNFKSLSVTGVITGNNISLTVPLGTDVSSLTAQFILSEGATVKVANNTQTSEQTTNNFTSPLKYVVTAQDGFTTREYTVTVTIQQSTLNTACEITAFSLKNPSVTGTIVGNNITLSVPSGTNLTGLIAQFTASTGAKVTIGTADQVSGLTANNFTAALTYTVTAEDGKTTKQYIVTVNVEKSAACEITAFSLKSPSVVGVISGDKITLTVPSGTSVASLVAEFTLSAGASAKIGTVAQTSGQTTNNFTTALTYTITAEDTKTTKQYIVNVNIEKSAACEITAFSLKSPSVVGVIAGDKITLTVPSGTNVSSLLAEFTLSNGASVKIGTVVQTSGQTTNNFTTPLTYTVTAEDTKTTKQYVVTVKVLPSTSCDILSFNLVSPNVFGIIIGNNISLNVPAGTNITNLIAQFTLSAGAKATVNSIDQISAQTSNDFTNLLTYTVTAEDKIATKQYSIKLIINQVQDLKIWSSDFTNSSDWVIKNNSATESLNWEITNAMPSSTTYGDLYGYWLTPASITSFKSTSGGNFLLMNASTPGTGVRTAIITKATPFNTLGKNNIKVQYNQLYRKWKDSAILEVSTDNQNWKKIIHNDLKYKSDASSSNPELVVTDISSIAGNKPQVWIRFRFLGTQAPGDYDYAWFIDDVEISEIPQNELHVYRGLISGQTDLVQSCMTNSNEIKIYVKNNGLTPLNTGTVPISYRINGGNILSENAKWLDYKTLQPKASLAYNDTALCVFNSKLDFSASNKYVIKAFTTLTNDSQVANDTATMMITNKTATLVTNNVSYSENFNSQSMNGFTSLSLTGSSKFKLSSEGNTSVVSATPAVCMAIEEGPGVSDDWTFSPCLDLKKDYLYTFSYYSNLNADIPANTSTGAPAFNFAANIEAKLGSANTVAGMTQPIVASKTLTPDSKYVKTETTFSVSQDGIYYIGFHVNNTDAAKIAAVYIDDISLTAKSKACDITSFNFKTPSVTGTITGNNISLIVPPGTDVSNLIAQFVLSEGATVKVGNNAQTSEQTTNNFTAPLQYVVTAQDGTTTKTYTVTVTIQQSSKSTACEIISFSLTNPSVTGTISGSNITLTVPNGTTVTNLIAQFTLSAGANAKIGTIAQTSGQTTNNFTTPLTYTITAEDGITNKTYIVTVNVATSGLSVAKDFLTFGFSNPLISAKISNDSITATLPSGTDASTLVAYFTVSPKATVSLNNIQQQSGKNINDFTTILKYVVTAEDGTKKTYTVKILVSPKLSTLKEILSFTFTNPSVTGIISGTTINLTVPDGTNLASLVAVFTVSPKATVKIGTVSQTSGVTSNNFTTTLVYTVTAEDGTTKNYTVIVNTQSTSGSSDKELISFGIYQPIIPGVINGTNVTITSSTKSIDVTSLIVSFEVSKGAKLVLSGTTLTSRVSKLNFLNPITVTVIAADGSKKDYTINLILPLSNLKQFTFFKIMNPFAEGKIDTLKKEIRLSVPYGTLVTQLQPVYMVSEAAKLFIGTFPQSSGLNTIDFSKPVVYTIVAEDGSKVNYTVYIEVLPKSTLGFEEQDQNVVSIYPNPSSGLFTLKATNGNVFISIMDAQGRVVLNQEVTSYAGEEMQLDLTQFGQGIYFATIQNNEFTKMLKLEVIE